jgi:hypothetical protein
MVGDNGELIIIVMSAGFDCISFDNIILTQINSSLTAVRGKCKTTEPSKDEKRSSDHLKIERTLYTVLQEEWELMGNGGQPKFNKR